MESVTDSLDSHRQFCTLISDFDLLSFFMLREQTPHFIFIKLFKTN